MSVTLALAEKLVEPNISSPWQASLDVQNVINNYLSNNSNQTCQ